MPNPDPHFPILSLYANEPAAFCRDVLGVNLWERQRAVLLALTSRSNQGVTVTGDPLVGKTFIGACAALWWAWSRLPALSVIVAPRRQLDGIFYREVKKLAKLAKLPVKVVGSTIVIGRENHIVALQSNSLVPNSLVGMHELENVLTIIDNADQLTQNDADDLCSVGCGPGDRQLYIGDLSKCSSGPFFNSHKFGSPHRQFVLNADIASRQGIPGLVSPEWLAERKAKWAAENKPHEA